MTRKLTAAEFLGSSDAQRLATYRQMAKEASDLAGSASSPKQRDIYLELVVQWNTLTQELEQRSFLTLDKLRVNN